MLSIQWNWLGAVVSVEDIITNEIPLNGMVLQVEYPGDIYD